MPRFAWWDVILTIVVCTFFGWLWGLKAGADHPGPGWIADPAAGCRATWAHCPADHYCETCGQHWDFNITSSVPWIRK